MPINEVFPNPTVKSVHFEIRYANLFFIQDKIGDFQVKVMDDFPESSLVLRRQVYFGDVGEDGKIINMPEVMRDDTVRKIWQFKSEKNYELNVTAGTLGIESKYHKTYRQEGADKFRDVIEHVLTNFFEITKIPRLNRIGLRYIDECPIPEKTNKKIREYYNTSFALDRFNIADAVEMTYRAAVKKGDYYIRYIETLKTEGDAYKLILDFDGYALKIDAKDYLIVTDKLHDLISAEYENTIKEPVKKYMRQHKEG